MESWLHRSVPNVVLDLGLAKLLLEDAVARHRVEPRDAHAAVPKRRGTAARAA